MSISVKKVGLRREALFDDVPNEEQVFEAGQLSLSQQLIDPAQALAQPRNGDANAHLRVTADTAAPYSERIAVVLDANPKKSALLVRRAVRLGLESGLREEILVLNEIGLVRCLQRVHCLLGLVAVPDIPAGHFLEIKGSVPLTLSEGGVEPWVADGVREIPSRSQNLLSNGNSKDLREPRRN